MCYNLIEGRDCALYVSPAQYRAHLMHNSFFVNLIYDSFPELLSVKLIPLISLFF